MSEEDKIRSDLAALNLRCLLVLRDLARDDPAKAFDVFGVSIEVAECVGALSVDEIHTLSKTAVLMYKPVIDKRSLDMLLTVPAPLRGGILEVRSASR